MSDSLTIFITPTGGRPVKKGPNISNALLVDEKSKLAAGTAAINANCSNRKIISGNGPYMGRIPPRTFVKYVRGVGSTVRGVVDKCARVIQISKDGDTVEFSGNTNLDIEIEAKG